MNGYWIWSPTAPGYAEYKNPILIAYQDALTATCKMPRDDQRLFVQQITQENGALNPDHVAGDNGYSYGIGQWYVYPTRAKTYLARHPEEATLEFQIGKLAAGSCDKYRQYPGDIRRAIVYHNRPKAAINNEKPKACGGVDRYAYIEGRGWSCYFKDEVDGSASRSRIVPQN